MSTISVCKNFISLYVTSGDKSGVDVREGRQSPGVLGVGGGWGMGYNCLASISTWHTSANVAGFMAGW